MDEGFAYLIVVLIAVAVVVAVIVAIASIIIGIGAVLLVGITVTGAVSGLVTGTRNFWQVFQEARQVVPRDAPPSTSRKDKQSAYLIYPWDRGWRIIEYVRSNLGSRTAGEARPWFDRSEQMSAKSRTADDVQKYWLLSAAGGFLLAGASHFLADRVIVMFFVAAEFSVMAAWYSMSRVAIVSIGAVTKAYAAWFRAHYRCPGCHESMDIPVFTCPTCATDHTRLWPSEYGVLHHMCSGCGTTQLPTTDWNGRRAVFRKCPHCSKPLNADIGLLTNVHIPVVGGPSSGKSNLIVTATEQLMRQAQASGSAAFSFPDPAHEREFEASLQRLHRGQELPKTPDLVPQALNISMRRPSDIVGKVVYFYDAAGEAYGTQANALQQSYYRYVDALLFVIDPFGIPSFRDEIAKGLDDVRNSLRPTSVGVMESYERMLEILETSVMLTRGRRFPHPLAVVLTKVDAFNLENVVGAVAARALMAAEPDVRTEGDAIDRLITRFLGYHQLDNFVRDAEQQFRKVRYFSCSALGRMPNPADARPFASVRVLEPLAWVLSELGVLHVGASDTAMHSGVPIPSASAPPPSAFG